MKIVFVNVRSENAALFAESDVLQWAKLTLTPLVAFIPVEGGIEVRIIEEVNEVFALDPATPMMVSWPGKWKSDFFHFTAGEWAAAKDALMKSREWKPK